MTPNSSTRRNVLFGVGVAAALTGFVTAVGGGALIWGHTTQRGSDGYYSTSTKAFATSSAALTSSDIDLGVNPADRPMAVDGFGSVTLRLQATSTSGKPVFVGVARARDAAAYLAGVGHDEVTDVNFSPFRVDYRHTAGERSPAPPAAQSIWVASATGTGTQTVTRPAGGGEWAVVIMNADASPGIRADVAVGAKTGILLPIGIGALVFGIAAMLGAGLAFFSASGSGRPGPQQPTLRAPGTPAAPPVPVP